MNFGVFTMVPVWVLIHPKAHWAKSYFLFLQLTRVWLLNMGREHILCLKIKLNPVLVIFVGVSDIQGLKEAFGLNCEALRNGAVLCWIVKSWTEEGDEQGGILQLSSFICKKKISCHRSLGLVKPSTTDFTRIGPTLNSLLHGPLF